MQLFNITSLPPSYTSVYASISLQNFLANFSISFCLIYRLYIYRLRKTLSGPTPYDIDL